ncbi:phenylacetic acid degradation protein PaaN [Marinactinospora thermotolerans]|uniref:Phenylacetic acid degradation protein paaN n=1 Tax=Marinactinospora thermotolerans DSM 45154 TaxID=1122192 RepID=A0A1T4R3R6_9ACTN|nr:phenylacetic acid degradation protein PaaN [Marinactinospora thermotolerans]SKA10278.1 phenylacetic acid degradation protein paaN [Marinactinospora thermotolerans DSM 45154]
MSGLPQTPVRDDVVGELVERHRPLLDRALEAVSTREYWAAYEEDRDAYGPDAEKEGEAAFQARLGKPFALGQPAVDGLVGPEPEQGGERSPFGSLLRISYPHVDPDRLFPAMRAAMRGWARTTPEERAAVCAEILARINRRSHEFAHAATHTSGQGSLMAFHAGAAHAQDRGLEAVAHVLAEQTRLPARVEWRKPTADGAEVLAKTFSPVPRGIGLVIGGRTVPTWSAYPGLFASLTAGNAVLVKPHPEAVLPLAMTVEVAREVLREAGFAPDLVCLAAEYPGEGVARDLATRPEVRIIDYTGKPDFGAWLRENCRQATVFTHTSAVNSLFVESTRDYRGLVGNVAFTLALYSGRLCTGPQNLFLPEAGIATDEGHKDFDRVIADIGAALDGLLSQGSESAELLGAIGDSETLECHRRAAAGEFGEVLHAAPGVSHPAHPAAELCTPVIVRGEAGADALFTEHPGPVYFAVPVPSAEQAFETMAETARRSGSLVAGVHTVRPDVREQAEEFARESGVNLSLDLTGPWLMTQASIFSDVHGTGANASGNAAVFHGSFVTSRFSVVGVRRRVDERDRP